MYVFGNEIVVGIQRRTVLFTETCYDDDLNRFKLICLESPILDPVYDSEMGPLPSKVPERSTSVGTSSDEETIDSYSSMGCQEFLCKNVFGKQLFGKMEVMIAEFKVASHHNIQKELGVLYLDCIDLAVRKHPHIRVQRSTEFSHKTCTALERHIMNSVNSLVLDHLAVEHWLKQSLFNKCIQNFRPKLKMKTAQCHQELLKMTEARSPGLKLQCLGRCIETLNGDADEVLKSMIRLVAESGVNNWFTHFHFMKDFRLSSNFLHETMEEDDFHLTVLEAALKHVASGGLDDDGEDSSSLELFESIMKSDTVKVSRLICNTFDPEETKSDHHKCHPLCDCDPIRPLKWFELTDSHGRNAIHIASGSHNSFVLDLMLNDLAQMKSSRSPVNGKDEKSATPLHLAASKGNQNALLLLLHANADLNLRNADGQTPLHLASANGHESCVKAIL